MTLHLVRPDSAPPPPEALAGEQPAEVAGLVDDAAADALLDAIFAADLVVVW